VKSYLYTNVEYNPVRSCSFLQLKQNPQSQWVYRQSVQYMFRWVSANISILFMYAYISRHALFNISF